MLLKRELEPATHDLMAELYTKDISVSVFADDDTAAGSAARTLVSAPNLYVPVTGLAGLADSGRKEVEAICKDVPIPPPAVRLPCQDDVSADVIIVVDVDSYLVENGGAADFDIANQILHSLDIGREKVHMALVLHSEKEEKPSVFVEKPGEKLYDILWNKRHESVVNRDATPQEINDLDYGPTFDFLMKNPVLPARNKAVSRTIVAISGRSHNIDNTDQLDDTLAFFEDEATSD